MHAFAEFLQHTQLTALVIVGDGDLALGEQLSILLSAMAAAPSLTAIDVTGNRMGVVPEGIEALRTLFQHDDLRSVAFDNNFIGLNGFESIAAAIPDTSALGALFQWVSGCAFVCASVSLCLCRCV